MTRSSSTTSGGFSSSLKRNRLIFRLNAARRAWQMERELRALQRHYARRCSTGAAWSRQHAIDAARARLSARGITLPRPPQGRLRIFWVGTDWNQDHAGFLQSLKRFGDVVECRVGDHYGLRLALRAGARDPLVVAANDAALLEQVRAEHAREPFDLLIGQMWASFVSADALRQIQDLGIANVNIALDDRLPEHWRWSNGVRVGAIGLAAGIDLTLTTAAECCAWYAAEGAPAIFWPMASDPELFYPVSEEEKSFDVSFVGSRYGVRDKIVRGLLERGLPVAAFGPGWPNGPVTADQSAEIFRKSRIILGVGNVGYSEKIFTLKLRDFDATMAGALYVTHRSDDLLLLFDEGREIECYRSIAECAEKIRFYLEHPAERAQIGRAAAERARREHTWDHRLTELMEILNLRANRGTAGGGDR